MGSQPLDPNANPSVFWARSAKEKPPAVLNPKPEEPGMKKQTHIFV